MTQFNPIKPSVLLFVRRVQGRTWRRDQNFPGFRAFAITTLMAKQAVGGFCRFRCALRKTKTGKPRLAGFFLPLRLPYKLAFPVKGEFKRILEGPAWSDSGRWEEPQLFWIRAQRPLIGQE